MDSQHFALFSEVAQRGSFSAVARSRGVDPSAVSRQIAALEAELGYPLFERTTRRLSLTEAGQLTLERMQPLFDEIEQVRQLARDSVTEPSGRLRLTTSVAFGERWLVPRLGGFRKAFPAISLDLALTDATLDLQAENIDLALRLGARMAGPLAGLRLMSAHYRVVASPDYLAGNGRPRQPAELAEHDAIVLPYRGFGASWRVRSRHAPTETEEVQIRDTLIISNALAARRAALQGLGVALLADWLIGPDLASGVLVDVLPDHEVSAAGFDSGVWLLYPERSHLPAKTRAMIEHLKSEARFPDGEAPPV